VFDVVWHSLIEFQIDHLEDIKYGADAEQASKINHSNDFLDKSSRRLSSHSFH
jgi:hypothetical protein